MKNRKHRAQTATASGSSPMAEEALQVPFPTGDCDGLAIRPTNPNQNAPSV
jgi:hypothetical protein